MPHFLPPEKRRERDAELEMTQEFEPSYSKGWTEQVKRIYGSAIVKNWNRVQFFEGVSRLETRPSFSTSYTHKISISGGEQHPASKQRHSGSGEIPPLFDGGDQSLMDFEKKDSGENKDLPRGVECF